MFNNVVDELAQSPGAPGDSARALLANPPQLGENESDYNTRLAGEQADATKQAAKSSLSQVKVQRIRARDFIERGLIPQTAASGTVEPVADEQGVPLTNFDKKNSIAWDSSGSPRKVGFDWTGSPELSDPYQNAPKQTDKAGNVYAAPAGLGWNWLGTDPTITAANQQKTDEQKQRKISTLNQQTSAALAEPESDAKAQFQRASKVVRQSAKGLAPVLASAGIPTTDDAGKPIDFSQADPTELRGKIDVAYAQTLRSPEANKTKWFNPDLSDEAKQLREQAAASRNAALQALQQHSATLAGAQQAQADLGAITSQRREFNAQRLAQINEQRIAAGLPPVLPKGQQSHIPGLDAPDDQDLSRDSSVAEQQAHTLPVEGSIPSPATTQANQPKLYSVDDKGAVKFTDGNLSESIAQAHQDGIIPDDFYQANADKAKQADEQYKQLMDEAGSNPKLKAFLDHGVKSFASFSGGAAASAAVAPFDPELASAGAFAGGIGAVILPLLAHGIAFLAGNALSRKAADALTAKVAQYSDTVKSFESAAKVEPGAAAVGDIAGALPAGIKSVTNLARLGSIEAAEQGIPAAAKLAAQRVAAGAGAGAAFEGTLRPGFDFAIQQGRQALGMSKEDVESPTTGSVVDSAILGAILAGESTKFKGYDTQEIAGLHQKYEQAKAQGVNPKDVLTQPEYDALELAQKKLDAIKANGGQLVTDPDKFSIRVRQALTPSGNVQAGTAKVEGVIPGLEKLSPTPSGENPSVDHPASETPPETRQTDQVVSAGGSDLVQPGDESPRSPSAETPQGFAVVPTQSGSAQSSLAPTVAQPPTSAVKKDEDQSQTAQNTNENTNENIPSNPAEQRIDASRGQLSADDGERHASDNDAVREQGADRGRVQSGQRGGDSGQGRDADSVAPADEQEAQSLQIERAAREKELLAAPNQITAELVKGRIAEIDARLSQITASAGAQGAGSPQDTPAQTTPPPQDTVSQPSQAEGSKPDTGAQEPIIPGLDTAPETTLAETAGQQPASPEDTAQSGKDQSPSPQGEQTPVSSAESSTDGKQAGIIPGLDSHEDVSTSGTSGEQPVHDSGQNEHVEHVRKVVQAALKPHAQILNAIGHGEKVTYGKTVGESGLEIARSPDRIVVDPVKLSAVTRKAGLDKHQELAFIRQALSQEVKHLVVLNWEKSQPGATSKIEAYGAQDDELSRFLAKSYTGWNALGKDPEGKRTPEEVEQMRNWARGHEKIRAVLEGRWDGEVTEAATGLFHDFLNWLRDFAKNLTGKAREIVTDIEARLKAMGIEPVTGEARKPAKPVKVEGLRDDTNKALDDALDGLAASRPMTGDELSKQDFSQFMKRQATWLLGKARSLGFKSLEDFRNQDEPRFKRATETWRDHHAAAAMRAIRERSSHIPGLASPTLGARSQHTESVSGIHENGRRVMRSPDEVRSPSAALGMRGQHSEQARPMGRVLERAIKAQEDITRAWGLRGQHNESLHASVPNKQTETPEFKKWFGDSRVVDEQGKPLVVYHGTPNKFLKFNTDRALPYFTNHKESAKMFGASAAAKSDGKFHTLEVFLRIENPVRPSQLGLDFKGDISKAQSAGYDGEIDVLRSGEIRYRPFHPEQIKSAMGNNGAFDPNNPSILAASAPDNAQVGIPADKVEPFIKVAHLLLRDGINTPEALAKVLDAKRPDGTLRKYSQALWSVLSAVKPELHGVHDWTQIYQTLSPSPATSGATNSKLETAATTTAGGENSLTHDHETNKDSEPAKQSQAEPASEPETGGTTGTPPAAVDSSTGKAGSGHSTGEQIAASGPLRPGDPVSLTQNGKPGEVTHIRGNKAVVKLKEGGNVAVPLHLLDRHQSGLFAADANQQNKHTSNENSTTNAGKVGGASGREIRAGDAGMDEQQRGRPHEGFTEKHARESLQKAQEVNAPFVERFREWGLKHIESSRVAGTGFATGIGTADIYVNPSQIATRMNAIAMRGLDPERWVAAAHQEEMIHSLDLLVSGEGYDQIHDDIWEALPNKARDAVYRTYGDTQNGIALASEYMRMLVQHRNGLPLTEATFGRNINAMIPMLNAKQPPEIQSHYEKIETALPIRLENQGFLAASTPMEWMRNAYDGAKDKIISEAVAAKDEHKSRDVKDKIAAGKDAVDTIAEHRGEQAGNSIKLDLPEKADRDAMPYVIEAGGDKAKLNAFRQKVATGKDAKLSKEELVKLDHGIANFDRLNNARTNHDTMMADSMARMKAAGVDAGEVENYVTRKLDAPDSVKDVLPSPLFSMGTGQGSSPKYFTKGRSFETLADAVAAGYRPKSTDLAELDRHRITAAERIIEQRAYLDRLRDTPAPTDGKPIIGEFEERKLANGKTELATPRGYSVVQANGQPLVVHQQFAPLFKDLFGTSAVRNTALGRAAIKLAAAAKHGTLVLDTFHVARVMFKMFTGGGGSPVTMRDGKPAFNIHAGLSVLEYSDADLSRAVAAGEITKEDASYARSMRPLADELMKAGMNIGRVADNLMEQAKLHLPIISGFNDWIFGKLSRGAMLQTALTAFQRNLKNPNYTREQAARQTAKEMNEMFSNLQSQGIFKSKTMQDIARVIFLAPQWTEGQFRYEARAYGQAGKSAFNGVRGKGFHVGNAARALATGFVALLAANQLVNFLSRGQSTFQNEEGHKLDAWIPGGKRGYWFNPFEIAGEYAHAVFKYLAQHENPVDIATHIASNKLSPVGRGLKEGLTGRDYAGRHFLSGADRARAAVVDALPFPMPLNSVFEKDPRSPTGLRFNRQPGSIQKQLMQSVGAKVSNAQSPRSEMFAIAQPFRADSGYHDSAGEYTELRRALDNDDTDSAASEVKWLIGRGKSLDNIKNAVGIEKNGSIKPETFTGNKDREQEMLRSLKPEQKAVYQKAQRDHFKNAAVLIRVLASMNAPRSIPRINAPALPSRAFKGF